MSENKKTHSLHIRFSEGEFVELKKSANAASMSIAEYVRTTSVRKQAAPQVKKIAITPAEDFRQSVRELAAVGSNLNQIASSLNRNGAFAESELLSALQILIKEIEGIKKDVVEVRERMV